MSPLIMYSEITISSSTWKTKSIQTWLKIVKIIKKKFSSKLVLQYSSHECTKFVFLDVTIDHSHDCTVKITISSSTWKINSIHTRHFTKTFTSIQSLVCNPVVENTLSWFFFFWMLPLITVQWLRDCWTCQRVQSDTDHSGCLLPLQWIAFLDDN